MLRNLSLTSNICRNTALEFRLNFVFVGWRKQSTFSVEKNNVEPELSYFHHIGKIPLVYRNMGQELARSAAKYGNAEAIVSVHEDKRFSFTELLAEVDRLAAGFLKLGLKRGDYIGLWGPNTMHWYISMLSAARAGLTSVGINPAYQATEIEYCLKKVPIKALITPEHFKSQNYYEILGAVCPELPKGSSGKLQSKNLPNLKYVIINTESNIPGALKLNDILDSVSSSEALKISTYQNKISPDLPCNVQFTSGTTGHPKAALISHYSLVNNGIHVGERNQLAGERICVQVPLFHAFGVAISIFAALSHGATLVMPAASFDPVASLKAIIKERCTIVHGTPTMYVDIIKKQKELRFPLSTIKRAITGGAPCSPQLFLDIKNVFGIEEVRTVYGLTETTAVIFQSRPNDNNNQILNTVGHIQDHIEAKVIDSEGNVVPFGERGELCIRGYCTMLGYFEDEDKTKETISWDRWLHTGDQFILQNNGYGQIVGRLKEMIIRGGENIFPKEIEDFLNTHPNIAENHVVGVPDERMGEELCAFIRLHDGGTEMSLDTVKKFAKGKISHFKVPRYIIVVQNFPKTTSGKIQKFKLQQLFAQRATNQTS